MPREHTAGDGVDIFECGDEPELCQTNGCGGPTTGACAFELTGRKLGQVCGRRVCKRCGREHERVTFCEVHHRIVTKPAPMVTV